MKRIEERPYYIKLCSYGGQCAEDLRRAIRSEDHYHQDESYHYNSIRELAHAG